VAATIVCDAALPMPDQKKHPGPRRLRTAAIRARTLPPVPYPSPYSELPPCRGPLSGRFILFPERVLRTLTLFSQLSPNDLSASNPVRRSNHSQPAWVLRFLRRRQMPRPISNDDAAKISKNFGDLSRSKLTRPPKNLGFEQIFVRTREPAITLFLNQRLGIKSGVASWASS
jgi:hypothetical protein